MVKKKEQNIFKPFEVHKHKQSKNINSEHFQTTKQLLNWIWLCY